MAITVFIGLCLRKTQDAGWVSVYWPSAQEPAAALADLDAMNTLELACLTTSVSCPYIKVSEVHTPGDIYFKIPQTSAGNIVPSGSGTSDPALALPVYVEAGPQHRGTRFLRGMDSSWLIPGDPAAWKPGIVGDPLLTAWLNNFPGKFSIYSRPGKRNNGVESLTAISGAFLKPGGGVGYYKASIRRAGRPFGLRRGRRMTG